MTPADYRKILDTLSDNEAFLVDNTIHVLEANASIIDVPLAKGQALADLEFALINFLVAGRCQPNGN